MAIEQKNTTSSLLVVLAIIAVLGVVVVSSFQASQPITVNTGDQSPDRNILTVTGTHELQVAPDQATITFSVITDDMSAKVASQENSDLMNAIVTALRAQGVAASDIETINIYLTKLTEWDYNRQRNIDKGYQQTATVKVTTKNLDGVGAILDAAIGAGANNVQDVAFSLTPTAEATYKEQALTEAAQVAKTKAQTLASASGASLGRITSLSENSYNYQPYYYNTRSVMMADAGAEKAPTPISPEKVSISVSVSIGYELN